MQASQRVCYEVSSSLHAPALTDQCLYPAVSELALAILASSGVGGIEMQRVLPLMCKNSAGSFSWFKQYITHQWSKVRQLVYHVSCFG
jgi:hypothetical protein